MPAADLKHNLADLPRGSYAIGVSGHADSTALLRLTLEVRPDCPLHVVHLDHELRGEESASDARFVADLAAQSHLPVTLARRSDFEHSQADWPANPSARYRAMRHTLLRQTVSHHRLQGALLAHHADDQAETIFQRLLRNAGPMGLAGMDLVTDMGGLSLLRPLLSVWKHELYEYLRAIGQPWREDGSNASDEYQRNCVRRLLAGSPELKTPLLELGRACGDLRHMVRRSAPVLGQKFASRVLADLPELLAMESARRWLIDRGVPAGELHPAVMQRLVSMAGDLASPARQAFPAGLIIRRRGGQISVFQ